MQVNNPPAAGNLKKAGQSIKIRKAATKMNIYSMCDSCSIIFSRTYSFIRITRASWIEKVKKQTSSRKYNGKKGLKIIQKRRLLWRGHILSHEETPGRKLE